MNSKIKIIFTLIFLTSCSDIIFEIPQPNYLNNLEKFPSKFHGNFKVDDKEYDIYESYCLINNDTLFLGSENLILKYQGNRLFVNLKDNNDYYKLYVLSRFNYLGIDELTINTIEVDSNFLDYLKLTEISYFDNDSSKILIKNSLSVNQLNTLINWRPYSRRIKFNSLYK